MIRTRMFGYGYALSSERHLREEVHLNVAWHQSHGLVPAGIEM